MEKLLLEKAMLLYSDKLIKQKNINQSHNIH